MSCEFLVCDLQLKGGVFPHLLFDLMHQILFLLSVLSEELLGAHETIQKYYKYELEVPLRLLHLNSLKHQVVRDVSQFTLLHLHYNSFTKRVGLSSKTCAWPLACLLSSGL